MGINTADILQAVMGNVTESVLVIGPDHSVLSFNEPTRRMFLTLKGLEITLGTDYSAFVSARYREEYMAAFRHAMQGNRIAVEKEFVVNGKPVWLQLRMSPLADTTNTIAGVIITIADIGEYKAKTAALDASETRFRSAFEHSAIGMALVSPAGQWLKVNKTLCEIVGYTEHELLGMGPDAITHPNDLEREQALLAGLLSGHTDHYSFEKRLIHKNGAGEWVSGVVSAIRDDDGSPQYFVWSFRHITERKRMVDRLKENEAILQLFVEHSPAAMAMFDLQMRYLQVSRRWLKDYHLGDEQLVGRCHYDVFPTIQQNWKDIHNRCLAGAVEKNEEDYFEREDGKREWLRWEIHPWRKASGQIGGIIMMTEVITGRKELERERRDMVMDLMDRNRDLSEFAEIVSHNLRGPLATILGLANVLREGITTAEKDVAMEGIAASAEKLDTVVREMNAILNKRRRL